MLIEKVSRVWTVALPQTDPAKPATQIAKIAASEESKMLMLIFDKRYGLKELRTGFNLTPAFARNLGEGLIKAADLADAAWKDAPAT